MKYAKPEIVVLAPAMKAIQNLQGVKGPVAIDTRPNASQNSNGAYEADE